MPRRRTIDHALTGANPVPPGTVARAELDAPLNDLGAALKLQPVASRTERPGRRWRIGLPRTLRGVALAGMIGVVTVGGATAAVLSTYTGHYNKGWEIKAGGPGELLLQGAPDFCQAALKLSYVVPYPPGYEAWRPWVLVAELGQPKVTTSGACGSNGSGGEGHAVDVSTGAIRGFFAMSAFCAWVYDWRDAGSSQNAIQASRAASVIAGALNWSAVTAEDSDPSAGPVTESSHGLTGDHSLFGWFIPFQSAVHRGDVARVNALIRSNYGTAGCSYFDPPADSDGGTLNPVVARQKGRS